MRDCPWSSPIKQLLTRAVIGGVSETLYARVVSDQLDQLPELWPDLVYCALVPYLGHARALAAVAAHTGG